MHRITLRIPDEIYKHVKQLQICKPYMSLNSIIVEAVAQTTIDKTLLSANNPIDPEILDKMNRRAGEYSANWKGGTCDYPEHREFQKKRLVIMKEYKGKCALCGSKSQEAHHMDCTKDNHDLDNLIPLCKKCHGSVHKNINRDPQLKEMDRDTLIQFMESA